MLKVDSKTANLPTLQNFDVIEKMDAGFVISDPKLIKFDQFQTKYIFADDYSMGVKNVSNSVLVTS